jgi:hypothetical protein
MRVIETDNLTFSTQEDEDDDLDELYEEFNL